MEEKFLLKAYTVSFTVGTVGTVLTCGLGITMLSSVHIHGLILSYLLGEGKEAETIGSRYALPLLSNLVKYFKCHWKVST